MDEKTIIDSEPKKESSIERLRAKFGHHFDNVNPDEIHEFFRGPRFECTNNERKFLDQIRSQGKLFKAYNKDAINLPHSVFHQDDFDFPITELLP